MSGVLNFRLQRGIQQKELAEAIGVSNVTICRYERNASNPQDVISEKDK
ncbi:MAG: helix-turn-helix transcriptional regulator [Elusimicrobia bacterium]|nr:helix-turn-helix transcriptional regulator [Elusimicrobiota bacterium]